MILKHLIKKSDFKNYVKSIDIPESMLKKTASPISWENDSYLNRCVKYSKSLGYLSIENAYARIEKRKIINKVLSYLLRRNYSCDAVFSELYSSKTPHANEKILKLHSKYTKGFWIRKRYIKALNEIHRNSAKLSRLFTHFKKTAKYPHEYNPFDFNKMKSSIVFLKDTDKYEGRSLTGKMSLTEVGLLLRKQKLDELNISLSDAQIKALWLNREYEKLSNANLERIGDLLCEDYKTIYRKEIDEYGDENKRSYNQKRYTPMKSLSAKEKKEKIIAMKAEGYTQIKTAEALEISESTVYRYWNK